MRFKSFLGAALACLCGGTVFLAGCALQGEEETPETTSVQETSTQTTSADLQAATESTSDSNISSAEKQFYKTEITDEIFERMEGKSFGEDCLTDLDDLRYIHVLHKDIDGAVHEGEMVCNRRIADDLLEIFEELYKESYPIEKMVLIDEYGADDELSMRDNNSSGFNFRLISGTDVISMHGEGLAVDINPLYNPFVTYVDGELYIEPDTAWDYVDRDESFPYKIEEDDLCVTLFKEHGFDWGGDWTEKKDYQHFEKVY